MDKQTVIDIRDDILRAALPDVVFDGWRWEGICRAAAKSGHGAGAARAVFPGKMVDVLDGFSDLADREMLGMLSGLDVDEVQGARVRDRVRTALLARFEFLLPHREAMRQSLQFWVMPMRKVWAAKIVWRSSDRIWNWVGDDSTDYNRYTKRGLLSGILISTTLVWLGDKAEAMDETKAFLDRRIENVMQFGKLVGKVKKARQA